MEENKVTIEKPTYALGKNVQDLADKNYYLYKNGAMTICPHLSGRSGEQIIAHPCGTFCHLFNLVPAKDKAGNKTDGLDALISCGSGLKLPIVGVGQPQQVADIVKEG